MDEGVAGHKADEGGSGPEKLVGELVCNGVREEPIKDEDDKTDAWEEPEIGWGSELGGAPREGIKKGNLRRELGVVKNKSGDLDDEASDGEKKWTTKGRNLPDLAFGDVLKGERGHYF